MAYLMRALHRDLGFLAIGLVIVYALSGIILIYRDTDFMKRTETVEKTLAPGLSAEQLGGELKMRGFKVTGQTSSTILFDGGTYDIGSGKAVYTQKSVVAPFDRFISLHKASSGNNKSHWALMLFGVILFFLALSSLFIYKPKTKLFRRGAWLTVVGVAVTVLLLLIK